MTVREVTYYQVVCDEPGCKEDSGTVGLSSYSAWADRDFALEQWDHALGWVDPVTGETFCPGHVPPQCEWCDKRATGKREGLDACGEHLRSEFPQEASNG